MKLTPEQEVYAHQFVQERTAAMLSTAAINEEEAEDHLRQVYRVKGYDPPVLRWFDAPRAFEEARFSREGVRTWSGVSDITTSTMEDDQFIYDVYPVREIIWDGMQSGVLYHVWEHLHESLGASIWGSEWEKVRESVWECVTSAGMDTLGESVWDSELECVGASVRAYMVHNELAFSRFFHELSEENPLIHLACLNEMVSGHRLGSTQAWLVRKAVRLECDAQGRLHSLDDMCLQYRDGWGFMPGMAYACRRD